MKSDEIRILDFSIYSGKNIYSHKPVMKMIIDIGMYGNIPTKDIPMFNEKLLKLFPGLKTNCCGLGYEGGFLDRLSEGTYLGHVLEHVILEIQFMLGYEVSYGKTRTITEPSLYYLIYQYQNEICGLECGKISVFILNNLLDGKDILLGEFLDYLKKISIDAELGPSTSAIVNEAKKRGIPVTRIGHECLVRLGYGKHSRLVESTLTDATPCISADISCNKQLTKYLLNEQKIPVPFGRVVYTEFSALMAAEQIGMPVVVKPLDSNQGKGVHLNVCSKKEIKEAFKNASTFSNGVIVEQFVKGSDYRVLVVGNEVRAVAKRVPAKVMGDGEHTVRELIEMTNLDPNRGEKHEKPLTKIRLDDIATSLLKRNGLTPDSVLPAGETVYLRENGNLSTGGTAIDYTDIIHPDNAEIAVKAAETIGIDIAGIDFVTEDISESILDTGGVICEVNTAPGIRMHLYPSEGQPRNVAEYIVDHLFPTAESGRFPIVSVTGTNGKTTVVRLIQHVLASIGRTVGMTSTSGTFINHKCIQKGDNSGPGSARSLLSNKSIDSAVLETARGGIIREGLGYDLADVGIITNITDDHLGLDGINTIDDLVFVKSLVVEEIREGGAAVLNAGDPSTPKVLERIKAKTILFSADLNAFTNYRHLDCVRVYNENSWIRIEDGMRVFDVSPVKDIPITLGGQIVCNIENALAAVSALYALGLSIDKIRAGLKSFTDNAGRFEQYAIDGIRVMLDYGHNPAGYETVIKTCERLGYRRLVGVIGMPGDRQDEAIRAVGKKCTAAFDQIIIKEDADLRGREDGEVAKLFLDSILESGYPQNQVIVIKEETQALAHALRESRKGDLVVVLYERLGPLQRLLEELGAEKLANELPVKSVANA